MKNLKVKKLMYKLNTLKLKERFLAVERVITDALNPKTKAILVGTIKQYEDENKDDLRLVSYANNEKVSIKAFTNLMFQTLLHNGKDKESVIKNTSVILNHVLSRWNSENPENPINVEDWQIITKSQ